MFLKLLEHCGPEVSTKASIARVYHQEVQLKSQEGLKKLGLFSQVYRAYWLVQLGSPFLNFFLFNVLQPACFLVHFDALISSIKFQMSKKFEVAEHLKSQFWPIMAVFIILCYERL